MPTVAPLDLQGHCIAAVFLDNVPHFALADGAIHRLDNGHKTRQANDGLLAAFHDAANDRLITGGEDGKVFAVKAGGEATELASAGKKWITSVAAGPQGAIAYAHGQDRLRALRRRQDPGICAIRAFGRGAGLLAQGHALRRRPLQWRDAAFPGRRGQAGGARMGWRPHRRHLLAGRCVPRPTTMQENALHGWKLADGVQAHAA